MQPWLDPEIETLLSTFSADELKGPSQGDLGELRAQVHAQVAKRRRSESVTRTDYLIPGPPRAPEVRVRVHRPIDLAARAPAIFSIHGGGLVRGTYESDDMAFDEWCPRLRCIGVSVDYRLAPENPYPGAIEDCRAGWTWMHKHADDLGIMANAVGLLGVSAGGGLAASLTILVRDSGSPAPAFQMLIYPMLDDRHITKSSRWDVPTWKPADNAFAWKAYLGDLYGSPSVPGTAAAAGEKNLVGLPDAFILVGGADCLSGEAIDYAHRLHDAGVPVDLHVYSGAPHGFNLRFPSAGVSRRAELDMLSWVSRRLTIVGS